MQVLVDLRHKHRIESLILRPLFREHGMGDPEIDREGIGVGNRFQNRSVFRATNHSGSIAFAGDVAQDGQKRNDIAVAAELDEGRSSHRAPAF